MIKTISPVSQVNARISLPGSKSITHRALLMAALAEGDSQLRNPLTAEDTQLTARALEQLGVRLRWEVDGITLSGSISRWSTPPSPIYLGNSGTSMRLLLALVAAGSGTFILDGTTRLRERPIDPVLQALQAQGTRCHYLGQEGYPPVEITGSGLTGGAISIDASQSSQFLSAMLLVSPCARSEMRIGWKDPVASLPYVHLTLSMMQQFGIRFEWLSTNQVRVPAPQPYQPRNFEVEGDCSSASYFWAAAALTGGRVTTSPVFHNSSQGDCRFLTILERMGCQVTWGEREVTVAGGGRLHGLDLDMNEMPDMVPTLAVVAAFADGTTRIRNVAHLRIKESDRLQVVALELSKLGVVVEELFDGLVIQGGKLHSAAIEAHDDHRIAMAFALAGLRVPGVEIHGAEAVAKSFPSFWDEFDRLCASS